MMHWFVKYYNVNSGLIEDYDVLKMRENKIKQLKKKYATKEDFAQAIKMELMSIYWSRSEWELIISLEGDKVLLYPWCGCKNPEDAVVDVTSDEWKRFAEYHINRQVFKTEAKIDVWDQIYWRFGEFIDYLWSTRLKYERKKEQ